MKKEALLLAPLLCIAHLSAQPSGVYTRQQAEEGKTEYQRHCATCHGTALEGGDFGGGPLKGEAFLASWQDRSIEDLLHLTRTTMPPGREGRLSSQTYVDILAYILQINEYPTGEAALSEESSAFQQMVSSSLPSSNQSPEASATAQQEYRTEVSDFVPVSAEMLRNPDPADWLMPSRTLDWQRYSPLSQIDRDTVGRLRLAWVRGMEPGLQETIPIVYDGVMYVVNPADVIQALDARSGDLIWEYRRQWPADLTDFVRSPDINRGLVIYGDLLLHGTGDGYVIAVDARTGKLRWETQAHDYKSGKNHTSGFTVGGGKVISGRTCPRDRCFIAAHDIQTGREVWRRYTTAAPGEPGGDTWGGLPLERRIHTSPWGVPGSYDPERRLVYWGVANPLPYPRVVRHGSATAIPRSSPAELYSNSTLALDVDTGEVVWYYQHLPGDDWDADHVNERILIDTVVSPDPAWVKWISPYLVPGQEREILITLGEPGGIWALDRETGQFLWAMPFPFDVPNFHISDIDVETGQTFINWDTVAQKVGDFRSVCYHNTKGYWQMAYSPDDNSLYIPYNDFCLEQTSNPETPTGAGPRFSKRRHGVPEDELAGLARVNASTGKMDLLYTQRVPSMGGILVTAGKLFFWGDLDRRFKAFDTETGAVLWETILGDSIQNGPITFEVDRRQYVAVLTGWAQTTGSKLRRMPEVRVPAGHNAIYVFALPEPR